MLPATSRGWREILSRPGLKCDGTRAETRFRLAKWTSPFKSTGASVQSTTRSGGLRISGSNAGYTMFRSSVKSTDYTLHSPVSPSLPLPCVMVCHHISTGLYHKLFPFSIKTLTGEGWCSQQYVTSPQRLYNSSAQQIRHVTTCVM
jgi:hypothetical protein